ncbi:uncharacterized protein LOC129787669 [Lutzomyia longipalpis]|uniref:uncharacterized protein LOC129787669 n=1 Tax=Lutzomyia longipalpis TaxID=7200 RepID=UPI0024835B4E|nr:uncharacterized protein LOC129787669 [Lutzomyia longipalpis]
MWSCRVIFLNVLLLLINSVASSGNYNELERNFIDNLEESFAEKWNSFEKEEIQDKIDNLIGNFVNLGEHEQHRRFRRDTQYSASDHLKLLGFEEMGSIPVSFPLDLCLMQAFGTTFAVALHTNGPQSDATTNTTEITFLQLIGSDFKTIYEGKLNKISKMDCIAAGDLAFVALSGDYRRGTKDVGSPVFQILPNDIKIVHYNRIEHQLMAKFWNYNNEIFLMETFETTRMPLEIRKKFLCPVYKWTEMGSFEVWNEIPCSDTVAVEFFGVNEDVFLVMGNSRSEKNSTKVPSVVYQFNEGAQKFVFHRAIVTDGLVDLKHFRVNDEDYLIVVNSPPKENNRDDYTIAPHSIIYKFTNGHFFPIQSLEIDDASEVLPVSATNDQVLLLFSSEKESIRIYEYDGWKFYESSVRYTAESFEFGVSTMRVYPYEKSPVILIANRRVFGETQNIFVPQFKTVPNYDVHEAMLEWCQESIAELSSFHLDGVVIAMENLPKATDKALEFSQGVEFASLKVEKLLTPEIRTNLVDLNEATAKEINSTNERVHVLNEKMNIISATMKNFLADKYGQVSQEALMQDLPIAESLTQDPTNETYEFDELFVDEISAEFINNIPSERLIRTDIPLNLSGIALECENLEILGELKVKNLIDGLKFDRDHILLKNSDAQHLNFTSLDTLIVRDLHLQNINSMNFSIILDALKKMETIGKNLTVLKADNLFVSGSINGIDLSFIEKYALRTEGNQIITQPAEIEHLVVDQVNVFKKISDKNISDAVLASHGDFLLNYPVSFMRNISVEDLKITERLKHIEVFDGVMDVVQLNSTEMQIVEGRKTFETVKLLKPIVLRGKIKSESLEKMNPMASVNENLLLTGDYFISGPVTVKRVLKTDDILSYRDSLSLQRLLSDGLPSDTVNIHQNINFHQPPKFNDLLTKSLNGINPENLVKINTDEIQTILGKKYFKTDLTVKEGFCDAAVIQGVNITDLNRSILHKSGDEEISGDIQFRKIMANSVNGDNVTLSGRNFRDFLHFDRDQYIAGNVTMKKEFSAQNLTVADLHGDGKISGVDIGSLITDTARKGERIILTGNKIFKGGLSIENLDVAYLPNFNISHVNGNFLDFMGKKIVWDSMEFTEEMEINEMTFQGFLNNIENFDFGNTWLLTEGDQNIATSQIFTNVEAHGEINLEGLLNKRNLRVLYENTYFINQQENLPEVEFVEDVTLHDDLVTNGTLSGLWMSQILNKKSGTSYKIPKLTVNGDLIVDKNLFIVDELNNINLPILANFLMPSSTNSLHRLVVHGNATFNMEPKVLFLNGWDIGKHFEDALMVYNKIHFDDFVHFHEAEFMGNVFIPGKINDINLTYVASNYMSLTKPQIIETKINFLSNVTLETPLSSSHIHVDGYLRAKRSGLTVKMEELNEKAAKIVGNQTIFGQWIVDRVKVEGDLEKALVNNLNMDQDVMRYDVEYNNVTALKKLHRLMVESIQCEHDCIIQDVNVKEWFAQAVFLIGNHTIHGTTTFKRAIFHTDITVHGLVNNITFNHDTVLTKDAEQTVEGNIYIDNRSRDRTKLHPLTIHQLQANNINERNVEDFLSNLATYNDYKTGQNFAKSLVVFEKPLTVEYLQCRGSLFGINMTEMVPEMEMAQELSAMEKKLQELYENAKKIRHYRSATFYVTHYAVAQTLKGDALKKIVPIDLVKNGKVNLHLAVLAGDANGTMINFYRLEEFQRKTFVESDIRPVRFADGDLVSINHLRLLGKDFLFTEKYSEAIGYKQIIFNYEHDTMKVIYERFTETPRRMASVKQNNQECIIEYSVKDFQVSVECTAVDESGKITWEPVQKLQIDGVREIIPLRANMFAAIAKNGSVNVLEYRRGEKWEEKQTLSIINPLDVSAETFDGKLYMAVCSGQTKNSVHHGSVEIYRLIGKQFVHFQHVQIEAPIRIQFSILPTGEFVLYILTGNPSQPLIVLIYSGMAGFRQFAVASTIPRGHRLSVIKYPQFRKEFVAVLSASEATLIEAVMR